MTDELNFDIAPCEVSVTVRDKSGQSRSYLLRETDGMTAQQYRNAVMKGMHFGPDGKPCRLEGIADVEPLLVSRCLFDVDTGKSIPLTVVQGWPSRVLKVLYAKVKEISGLDEKPETRESLLKQRGEIDKALAGLDEGEPGKDPM